MINELFELARRRRFCRRYSGEKIPDEIISEILKVALLAPSSWGGHSIEFVVVRNKKNRPMQTHGRGSSTASRRCHCRYG